MANTEMEDPLLTVAEVADMLRLNQQTVRNWIDQGALPAVRIGRRVRIRRSEFDRLLQQGLRVPGSAGGDGPSPEDFWGGESVAGADPAPTAATDLT